MTNVQYPNVDKTFQQAMSEVLESFFSTGTTVSVNGVDHTIHKTDIHFNIDKMENPSEYPKFVLVGSRWTETARTKCIDVESQELVKVVRGNLLRTAYVSIPRSGMSTIAVGDTSRKVQTSWQVAVDTWAMFCLIFASQRPLFDPRGVSAPRLNPFPVQVGNPQHYLLYGQFDCKIQFIEPRS